MTSESFCLTFDDHVKKRHPDFLCVRLCFHPPMFPSAYVPVSLCSRQPAFLSACVSVHLRLCPPASLSACVSVRLYPCLSASPPVCTPASLHPRQSAPSARSPPSLISPIFITLIHFCLFFSLVLFFPFFPLSFHSSFSLSLLLSLSLYFFFFSDIFSSYSPDSSCSSRDTPFPVKNPVSRAKFAKLRRTPCSDTPF